MLHPEYWSALSVRRQITSALTLCAFARLDSRYGLFSRATNRLATAKYIAVSVNRKINGTDHRLSSEEVMKLRALLRTLTSQIESADPLWSVDSMPRSAA